MRSLLIGMLDEYVRLLSFLLLYIYSVIFISLSRIDTLLPFRIVKVFLYNILSKFVLRFSFKVFQAIIQITRNQIIKKQNSLTGTK